VITPAGVLPTIASWLLWAGLNVDPGDLPANASPCYPIELIRALLAVRRTTQR
jgi:hypothetical protein